MKGARERRLICDRRVNADGGRTVIVAVELANLQKRSYWSNSTRRALSSQSPTVADCSRLTASSGLLLPQ